MQELLEAIAEPRRREILRLVRERGAARRGDRGDFRPRRRGPAISQHLRCCERQAARRAARGHPAPLPRPPGGLRRSTRVVSQLRDDRLEILLAKRRPNRGDGIMPTIATEPIIKEIHVDAQPETASASFTEADKLTRWLAAEAATDRWPGAIFHETHRVEGVDYLLRASSSRSTRPTASSSRGVLRLGDRVSPGRTPSRRRSPPMTAAPIYARVLRLARAGALGRRRGLRHGAGQVCPDTGRAAATERGDTIQLDNIVSAEEWKAALEELLIEDKTPTAPAMRWPSATLHADDGRGQGLCVRGPDGRLSRSTCSRAVGSRSSTAPSTGQRSPPTQRAALTQSGL